ncbi:hypothetical protein [Streptomyces chryseus]|uniref:DUF4276 family protein n=1 Tax=Streptomyces chryseus TaxID=68186 RepID=A0ABQ3EDT0_9ACTN|nr:hypothetical protein [Streptomyces chryseus]GGX39335.1 hypothetical protein GCM10010353_63460 [Streptomyces chryseus]GHB27722.1 hypothetical protein GCM10010346_58990 [Streptomyces chryseus]
MSRAPRRRRSVIVVAGESNNDREVLQHLIPALYPRCPKVVAINDKIKLAPALLQLSPRVETLRDSALRMAEGCNAELVGFVVHADMDQISDQRYDQVRDRITTQMRKTLPCHSALALSAVEMESWLMLFPDAFPKVRRGWAMRSEDRQKDLTKLANPKEHLEKHLGKPRYRESDSPKIMAAAVDLGHVIARPPGNNRSFRDFADQLAAWKKK